MTKRHTMLPIVMVIVIALLALIAILTGGPKDLGVVGNPAYPHHICTFDSYCAGSECNRDDVSFVVYLEYEDGNPRLEMPGASTITAMERFDNRLEFETSGGEISGTLVLLRNRKFDFIGSAVGDEGIVEHFATGSCMRLHEP
ncbi:hypothetical protein L0666_03065 [Octadecabacter sp. CECT 8868]|uniref:hypothetical protein n=1 Tax=Octadecabacter algicola TaxID=2909342 RepID=UPI001F2151AE|nr:hypothetical protein [Octadecabacter algicola]MCF2903956.1 hypothetical protein [Octadecabacter algicola]